MRAKHTKSMSHSFMFWLTLVAIVGLICRMWPVVMCSLIGMAVYAVYKRVKRSSSRPLQQASEGFNVEPPPLVPAETEHDLYVKLFNLLQKRITQHLAVSYPSVRWVWTETKPFERFLNDDFMSIQLSRAGGYRGAMVVVKNLAFVDIDCDQDFNRAFPDLDEDDRISDEDSEDMFGGDYELLAFEWVDGNMKHINELFSKALAARDTVFLLPSKMLPGKKAIPKICDELHKKGFFSVEPHEDGIMVYLPK